MTKSYRPYTPKQAYLLPPSPLEWLPEGHLAHFVMDVVAQLDLSPIHRRLQATDPRGVQPYHPAMMTALLVYGYCVGVASSRKIEKKTYEDVAFRVIAGENHPDHTRISEFRRVHLDALAGLFVQVLELAKKAKLVKLGNVALDGTKMKANASKHKAMSYERMDKETARLRQKVNDLLAVAEAADAEEDAEYGRDCRGDELPEELRRAETRIARIEQLRAELEAEARQQAEEEAAKDDDDPPPAPKETPLLETVCPHCRVPLRLISLIKSEPPSSASTTTGALSRRQRSARSGTRATCTIERAIPASTSITCRSTATRSPTGHTTSSSREPMTSRANSCNGRPS